MLDPLGVVSGHPRNGYVIRRMLSARRCGYSGRPAGSGQISTGGSALGCTTTTTRRSWVAWAAALVAGFTFSLESTATGGADPPPPSVTTIFPTSPMFVSGCFSLLMCTVPPVVTVTPSVTTGALGELTFSAKPSSTLLVRMDCVDVTVNWHNLSTDAAGSAVLRGVTADLSRPVTVEDRCRYIPVVVVTGSGAVAASADVGASADPNRFQYSVAPGFVIVTAP